MSDEELLAIAKQSGLLSSLSDQAYDSVMSGDYKVLKQFVQRILEHTHRLESLRDPKR